MSAPTDKAEPVMVEPQKPQADEPDEYHGAIRVTPEELARLQAESEAAEAALQAKRAAQAQFPTPDLKAVRDELLSDIAVPPRKRALNRENVERLKESIRTLGLRTPISVRCIDDDEDPRPERYELVTGAHRYQACLELGWADIPVHLERGSGIDAELWEIAENLDRSELSVLEEAEHIRDWERLIAQRDQEAAAKPAQLAQVKGGRGQKGGASETARQLGVSRRQVERSRAIADLPPETKAAAADLALDVNQSALLKAAKAATPDEQIAALRDHAAPKPTAPKAAPPSRPAAPGRSSARRRDEAIVALVPLLRAKPGETTEDLMHVLADEPRLAALPLHRRVALGHGLIKALGVSLSDLRSPIATVAAVAPRPAPEAPAPPLTGKTLFIAVSLALKEEGRGSLNRLAASMGRNATYLNGVLNGGKEPAEGIEGKLRAYLVRRAEAAPKASPAPG